MASTQFSSHQEHYPSRSGGALGGDRKAATALVFQDVVGGVASTVAVQGDDGTVIAIQASALLTDNVVFNATTVFVAALGGGKIYVEEADYTLAATWNVSVDIFVQGAGWDAILNYDAGGNCITVTGNNVKLRDIKIEITAGAGGVGTRPNGVLADTRTNIELFGVWVIGDTSVADDGSAVRQCGVVLDTVTESKIIGCRLEDNDRHSISLEGSDDTALLGNTCQGNTREGIFLNESDFNAVSDNHCLDNVRHGIFLGSSDDNTVSINVCRGNTLEGIFLSVSVDNDLTGNICQGNTLEGIRLGFTSNDNTLTGNVCRGNTVDGIILDNDSDDNLIHSNTCDDNGRFGINVSEVDCDRNWCKNNQLRGNVTAAFNDAGTDTKTPFINVLAPNQDVFVGATLSNHRGQQCLDDVTTQVPFEIPIPNEFQEIVTAHVIYVTGATGTINRSVATDFGKVCAGEQIDTHSDAIAAADIAGNTEDEFECDEISAALTGLAAGDWIGLTWTNFGAAAGTINATVWVIGIRLRYV